jgi:hypothetical protein
MSAPREALRAATEAAAEAEAVRERANVALDRIVQLVKCAEEELAPYADADRRITEHRAAFMIAYATDGPMPDRYAVPEALLDDRKRKIEAEERLEAARFSHRRLVSDRNTAECAAKDARASVVSAAGDVVRYEGDAIAADLLKAEGEALRLRTELEGLSRLWTLNENGASRPLALSPAIRAVLEDQPLNVKPPPGPVGAAGAAAGSRWWTYFEALQRDPDATV